MTTKLTLTVEKSIIERAKSYAKNTGRSLSELIENYLETITQEKFDCKTARLKPEHLIISSFINTLNHFFI